MMHNFQQDNYHYLTRPIVNTKPKFSWGDLVPRV